MRPFITIDPRAKLLVACSLQKRPRLFWSLFLLPVAAAVGATVILPRFWFAYFVDVVGAFAFLLVVVQGIELRVAESNWGRFEREKQPIRYWISQSIWTAVWIIVSVFPIALALHKSP